MHLDSVGWGILKSRRAVGWVSVWFCICFHDVDGLPLLEVPEATGHGVGDISGSVVGDSGIRLDPGELSP